MWSCIRNPAEKGPLIWEEVISVLVSPMFVSGIKRNFEIYIPNTNEVFLELESYL